MRAMSCKLHAWDAHQQQTIPQRHNKSQQARVHGFSKFQVRISAISRMTRLPCGENYNSPMRPSVQIALQELAFALVSGASAQHLRIEHLRCWRPRKANFPTCFWVWWGLYLVKVTMIFFRGRYCFGISPKTVEPGVQVRGEVEVSSYATADPQQTPQKS